MVSFQAGTVKTDSGTEQKEQTQQSDKASKEGGEELRDRCYYCKNVSMYRCDGCGM